MMRNHFNERPRAAGRTAARRWTVLISWMASGMLGLALLANEAMAQEAHWIWAAEHDKESVPEGACHFRKQFTVTAPEAGQIFIAADDQYELYLNGRRIGSGQSARKLDRYEITRQLARGRNIVAIKVNNTHGSTAAVAARVLIKERSRGWLSYSTDTSWRTNLSPLPLWFTPLYSDTRWPVAQSFGQLGKTVPWDRQESVAAATEQAERTQAPVEVHRNERFQVDPEFEVQRVVDGDQTGSLIAMTFNEFGHVICSREGGELLLIHDSNNDGAVDQVRVYCDKVKNCQGILCLNGEVFVTGEGPDGVGLYRLADEDRNGDLERVTMLVKFPGEMGEHGPHGVTLGPDGLLYVVVGNHSQPEREFAADSPHHGFYEGDLVGPRYEDPGGHAVGVKVPGGTVVRTDIEGKKVELVAGGLRNAYDLAFNREGELFTFDSDMESDMGMTWYRPTQVFHLAAGAEYGWRSGWAKWPDYFFDSLPGMLDAGRGSPTGMVVYEHYHFPKRLHNALFMGDWSRGRILAVTLKPNGATYAANSEVFLEGDPLNVTDLAVGPDGWLYFTTGGRGTGGGVYRVLWKGETPAAAKDLGQGLSSVIRQPQMHSAWSRQKIAREKQEMGDRWDKLLPGVALSTANPWYYRTRALDVMQLFGPPPTTDLLIDLSKAKNERVRAKAAELMGLHSDDGTRDALVEMLGDSDRRVRRKACEALVRAGQSPPLDQLIELLKSDDRFEAWAARRCLEKMPVESWKDIVLRSKDHRVIIQGGLALLVAHPSKEHSLDVIGRIDTLMHDFISDRDFIDMMRLLQVALHRGEIEPQEVPHLQELLAEEFPSGDHVINRELVRLLAYLDVSSIMDRYIAHLNSETVPALEKLHLALHLRFIADGWTAEQRLSVLDFFETAQQRQGGESYSRYVMHVTRDFAKNLTLDEARLILADGARWPNASIAALYKLPKEVDAETLKLLKRLDRDLADVPTATANRVKVGIVAVLARDGGKESLEMLRSIWDQDPERRQAVAMGLSRFPSEENWSYLLRSLPVLESPVAREVLVKLRDVNLAPEEPEYYRQVILQALQLGDDGADQAVALLEHWTERRQSSSDDDWKTAVAAWQQWYQNKWPDRPAAKLPEDKPEATWHFEDLLTHLTSLEGGHGSAVRGAKVFEKAQCAKCHKFGDIGEGGGPDLTSLNKRFMRKEILESILFPSHIISDQYAAKTVITTKGRQYTGLVAPGAVGETVILQSDGKKISINNDDIDEIVRSKSSVMPEGLLDNLDLEEISDLFAFLKAVPETRLANRNNDSETQ